MYSSFLVLKIFTFMGIFFVSTVHHILVCLLNVVCLPDIIFKNIQKQTWKEKFEKCTLKNFAKFTGKHPCRSLSFSENCRHQARNFIKMETPTQAGVFLGIWQKVFKNTFFYRRLLVAASYLYIYAFILTKFFNSTLICTYCC